MKIEVFSDVVCIWSYGEEKVLRAIDYIYDGKVSFVNTMGALIADYRDILPMNMKDKDSKQTANNILLSLWKSGSLIHKMPIMKNSPDLLSKENSSTFFINRGFITGRIIDPEKANDYLRELRLATILYGENTMDFDVLVDIAKRVGIDTEDFKNIFREESLEAHLQDRMRCFDRRFEHYPDFMYTDENGKEFILKGYKSKDELIKFIDQHSDLEKREIRLDKESILDFIEKYKKVFPAELVEVFENEEKIEEILTELEKENKISISEIGTDREIKINN